MRPLAKAYYVSTTRVELALQAMDNDKVAPLVDQWAKDLQAVEDAIERSML